MSKHTKGPWEARTSLFEPESFDITAFGIGALALVKSEANARLISAAPELLEFAIDWLSRQGDDDNYMTAKARAAIAKAKGEQA